jgi:predicted secreted hydrolase
MSIMNFQHLFLKLLLVLALVGDNCIAFAEDYQPPLTTTNGFAVPQPGHVLSFSKDHGSHPEFKIEWWYITGHLFGADKRRFGFQATFFRSAGTPHATNESAFSPDSIYLAHMALLDVRSGKFLHQERLNRAGWDAFSKTGELVLRNGNWALRMTDTNRETMMVNGSLRGEAAFQLQLHPAKPLVVFGKNSVSRKAADLTAASYYLTFPRLQATGEVTFAGQKIPVQGQAWMDHEISSSQLAEGQAGWDWTSIQLRDGREIMAYRMRRKDGSTDPFSTLAWVNAAGKVTHLASDELTIEPVRTWKSPTTSAVYPVSIRLKTRDPQSNQPVSFVLEPLVDAQELAGAGGSLSYWEGGCRVLDEQKREVGSAFLELTGYAGNLQNSLR